MTERQPWYERPRLFALIFGLCVAVSVLPLWLVRHLPAVDIPEHLFLIHVLRRLSAGDEFYAAQYVAKPGLTYLTAYYSVKGLASLMGLEYAMRLWLTLVLAGIPVSIAYLLRIFGKSPWLALLAIPLAYTSNFYWGLISFLSSIPLTILSVAFFAEVLQDRSRRIGPVIGLALSLVLLQLTHAAGIIFPAVALPLMLVTTRTDWPRVGRALLGVAPGVLLFLAWLLIGVGQGRRMGAPGEPWKASAPMLDRSNFVFVPLRDRARGFWDLLSSGFWSWADRPPLYALLVLTALVIVAMVLWSQREKRTVESSRPELLFLLALAFYFFLPESITGYMTQIYSRYAQLAALLAIPVLSLPTPRAKQLFIPLAAALSIYSAVTLGGLFHQFDREAEQFEPVAAAIPPNSRIMHLITDRGSAVSAMPIYLHYTALAAMRRNGFPSFSLAIDPSFPVGYRDGLPPAPPSEWQPQRFSWDAHARHYDYFLFRGNQPPLSLFGSHAADVEVVQQSGKWALLKKKGGAEP